MYLIEFCGALFLGMLTQAIINDSVAITACRMDFLELETILEELSALLNNHHRSPGEEMHKIKHCKQVLQKLNANYAGLFVGSVKLQKMMNATLEQIYNWKDVPVDGFQKYTIVGLNITSIWNNDISSIKEFLHASLFWRLRNRVHVLLESLPKHICVR